MNDETEHKFRGLDLVSDAVNAKPVNDRCLDEFKAMLENDFEKGLCNEVPGVNHAETMKEMESILREMQLIAQCPELSSKNTGAIGGAYSSGKSCFINSFLDSGSEEGLLAEGITPVTVIPSYVICGKTSRIKGISFQDGVFDISPETYKSLKHDFVSRTFTFDLNRLVSYTTVLSPMKGEYFKNICLIDTPGYDAAASGNTERDFENARRYIKEAKFLIWLIKIGAGTIPKSDIAFLRKIGMFGLNADYPLYIVASRAEDKNASDRKKILDMFEKTLNENRISYAGISAYDSMTGEMHEHRKKDLFQFFSEHNKPSEKHAELNKTLHEVFKRYIEEVHAKDDEEKLIREKVKKIMWAASEVISSDDSVSGRIEEGLNYLFNYFNPKKKDERLKIIRETRGNFFACLKKFCQAHGLNIDKTPY
ncbi:MAG: dynamin family protein [Treponema sp.]|nr:dynamin family protein [Treponema sp.]